MASSAIRNQISGKLLRPVAIAVLNESDFYRLRSQRSARGLPDHYQDWLDEREGLLIGLAAAGVRTIRIAVDLERFLAWCTADSIALDDAALDRFVALTEDATAPRGDFPLPAEHGYAVVEQARFGNLN